MAELKVFQAGTEQLKWPKLPITSQQLSMWEKVRTSYVWSQPCLTSIWFSMMADPDKDLAHFTDRIRVAATDDQFMYINPVTYFSDKYNLLNRVFIGGHEICHNIFNHCGLMWRYNKIGHILYPDGVKLPFSMEKSQISSDALVNDMLIQSKVGEMPKGGIHMPKLITYEDDFHSAYRKYYQDQNPPPRTTFGGWRGQQSQSSNQHGSGQGAMGQRGNQGAQASKGDPTAGDGAGSFDEHLQPGEPQGKAPHEAEQERDQQAWDNAVRSALTIAKGAGKLPGALEQGLSKLLTPRVSWQEHLYFSVSRKMGNETSSWEILDNEFMLRGIGAPGKRGYGCRLIVWVCDSSGSINQRTMDMMFSEGAGMMEEMRPQRLIVMQCDARIQECIEINDPSEMVRPLKGRGGTSFLPPFEWIDKEGLIPDAVVYLTDLDGPFPKFQPSYPVIWGSITPGVKAPWGETIEIPKQVNQ